MAYKNRSDAREYERKWYRKNSQRRQASNARSEARAVQRYRNIKASHACAKCNESDPDCLTFHHRDASTKLFDIGTAGSQGSVGMQKLMAEIKKCDCLCANCHMKLEAKIRRGEVVTTRQKVTLPLFDAIK